ncbi:MAG: hypothetical protein ABMB14_22770, partial [Myxococcota bacterium]
MRLRAVLDRSIAEGVLFAGMVGLGEFWFAADAIRLGATPLALAALVTVPPLVGALGAIAMLRGLRCATHRRPWVVAAALGQAAVLAGLAIATGLGWTTPTGLVVAASVHAGFGQAGGTGWASWFGELVPARLRGRWFGCRNRWVSAATFLTIVVGGLFLHAVEPVGGASTGIGFALAYAAAAGLRAIGARLLATTWEPRFEAPAPVDHAVAMLTAPDGRAARGVVGAGAAILLAVCIATPFFSAHMLDTLGFSYLTFLGAQAVMVATKVFALGPWGRFVDRVGPIKAFRWSAALVALVPVPWVVADRASIVYLAQALSGVAWAGQEVSLLALTLGAVGPRRRAVLLATQSLANGVAQVGGGLLGTAVAEAAGGHPASFAASAFARMVVAVVSEHPKAVGSTEGMARSRATSPFWDAWVALGQPSVAEARAAVQRRDLEALGTVMERSTFAMHGTMHGSTPPLLYWQPQTVAALHEVFRLRAAGVSAWATMDAGPQVKVLCGPESVDDVLDALVPHVLRVDVHGPGGPARVVG